MINERSSAQPNTPTSANMQYGYPPSHFDMINMQTMQNPNDLYSYYPASLYQPFGTFDEHNQWGSTDTTGNVPQPPPGPMQYHPQMYTPSPLDIPRTPFDYPPPHGYPHYHPGFTPSTFAGPPSAGTSAFDMPWNPHSLPMQQIPVAPQQMTPIGGGPATNKKPSVYDDYQSGGVGDMLAQHMNAVDLGTNVSNDDAHNYDNGTNDNSSNINVLSSKDQQQQHYQSNTSNISLSSRSNQTPQSSVPSGPKSYASVVSADTLNNNNNKTSSPVSNLSLRQTGQSTANERNTNNNNNPTSNFSTDSNNSRSNTNFRGSNNTNNTNNYSQQTRNGASGFNPRNQQQSSSSASGGAYHNWSNNNFSSNSRTHNTNSSPTYYNNASSNYYERPSYSQQQNSSSNNNNNKRQNSNYQQNYSSRTTNNMNNGNATASAIGQQPMSAANQEFLETLKRTHQYNPKDFNLNPKGARFFVIKSYSEDDVHRSIKYNIWCSTEHGNKRLDAAFREREGKGPIYLFFSVNASGHFCGMAEMMSPVDYEHKTDVWQMSNKWQGKFEIKWIYVKDVPNQQFRNIRLENNENKPVTNSRDTQEIPYEKGKLMLKTLHMYRDKTSIFDDFQYYESKQAEEATNPVSNHNNNNTNTTNSTSTIKKNSSNDFNNNQTNYSRGNNSNKRQYSANRTSATNQFEQQQQQTDENDEDDTNN